VTGWDGAILKNAIVDCGGWVMVRSPAGAVAGMETVEAEVDFAVVDILRALSGLELEKVIPELGRECERPGETRVAQNRVTRRGAT
jgi:hypothetical protein